MIMKCVSVIYSIAGEFVNVFHVFINSLCVVSYPLDVLNVCVFIIFPSDVFLHMHNDYV